jgi:hypothetical protein
MKIAFFAYVDPEEGAVGRFAGFGQHNEEGVYPSHPGCVVIDVMECETWNEARRHGNFLGDFEPDDGTHDPDFALDKEHISSERLMPRFRQLSNFQRHFVMGNLEKFWDVFVAGDPELLGSSCGCCEAKRALLGEVFAVHEPAPEPKMSQQELDALLPPTCETCQGIHPGQPCPPCGNCHHAGHGSKWCEAPATGYAAGNRCLCYPGYGKKS